jgi:hypothetical protein
MNKMEGLIYTLDMEHAPGEKVVLMVDGTTAQEMARCLRGMRPEDGARITHFVISEECSLGVHRYPNGR